jgi:hypothetical protein
MVVPANGVVPTVEPAAPLVVAPTVVPAEVLPVVVEVPPVTVWAWAQAMVSAKPQASAIRVLNMCIPFLVQSG